MAYFVLSFRLYYPNNKMLLRTLHKRNDKIHILGYTWKRKLNFPGISRFPQYIKIYKLLRLAITQVCNYSPLMETKFISSSTYEPCVRSL